MALALMPSSGICYSSKDDGHSTQYGTTVEYGEIYGQRIEHTIESKFQLEVTDLVTKVVGFKELGEYGDVADMVENLIQLAMKPSSRSDKKKGLDPQKRQLCESANGWFTWKLDDVDKPENECKMYPYIMDYM
ncbi:hypothetical protein IWQ61_007303, partial [Dispira simplex]